MAVSVCRLWPPSHCVVPYSPNVTLLTLEPGGSGLVSLLTTALFDGTRLFTYSKGKWETHAELGEMRRGGGTGAKHKMLYVGSKPGMSESGPLWPVQPGFLPFSPCTAKSSQTDI